MDEKTAALREVFIETTGADTVTESQEESPGSLTGRDDDEVAARIASIIVTMRERYEFRTDLDDAEYGVLLDTYFNEGTTGDGPVADGVDDVADGDTLQTVNDATESTDATDPSDTDEGAHRHRLDVAIAELLGTAPDTIRDARFDLHLVDEHDREAPFDYTRLKRLIADGCSVETCATDLGIDVDTAARYAEVARTELTSTRANDRFRDEFRELLTDAEIEGSYAASAREDGLRDATEDLETDVSL